MGTKQRYCPSELCPQPATGREREVWIRPGTMMQSHSPNLYETERRWLAKQHRSMIRRKKVPVYSGSLQHDHTKPHHVSYWCSVPVLFSSSTQRSMSKAPRHTPLISSIAATHHTCTFTNFFPTKDLNINKLQYKIYVESKTRTACYLRISSRLLKFMNCFFCRLTSHSLDSSANCAQSHAFRRVFWGPQ
jgi:hypothetical protein